MGGGGGGFPTNFFFKNVPGVLKRMYKFCLGGILGCFGHPTSPPGGRTGLENYTLLPMTMTCDRLKFWSTHTQTHIYTQLMCLAVKNYHPETLAAKKKKNSDKIIRNSRR